MRVWGIVVNWNGGEELLTCLASMRYQDPPLDGVVLVDNASIDGSAARALEEHPWIEVIENDENLGYGDANNQGIRFAMERGAQGLLLVNNDAVLLRDSVALLVEALVRRPKVGIVGPRVLLKGGSDMIWSAGGVVTWRENLTTLIGHLRAEEPGLRELRIVDYIPGCVMLIQREVVEDVGFLDGRFFAYMEDVDYCLRASEAGHDSLYVGRAVAFHRGSASTGTGYTDRRKYMMGVNSVWFLRKYGRPIHWFRFFLFDFLTLPAAWIGAAMRGQGSAVRAKGKGILDGLRGRRVGAELVREGSKGIWSWRFPTESTADRTEESP